jgi:hypothetical protein
MSEAENYYAVYDFEILPYALGDVLTWNIQTAIRCEEAGRKRVQVLILADSQYPSSIYQRDLVFAENAPLFFNELFGAFGTHPHLGNIHIFSKREDLLAFLNDAAEGDPVTQDVLDDYRTVLAGREDSDALNTYFIKYIYSHDRINTFAEENGRIPLLTSSAGCEPDVDGVMRHALGGKKVVVIHPRLRQLDAGLKGEHTHFRDSDFLVWYEFLLGAIDKYSDVQFVVVGRMQEKPVALLRLPNVTNLRAMGLGLGHEITLMFKSHLFIGTSSGFAAAANFSNVPYFVTKMNKASYEAYGIPEHADRLPFAAQNQLLVSTPESVEMLEALLEKGLAGVEAGEVVGGSRRSDLSAKAFTKNQDEHLADFASTHRFFVDDLQNDQEIAALVEREISDAAHAAAAGDREAANRTHARITKLFPQLVGRHNQLDGLPDATKSPLRHMQGNIRIRARPAANLVSRVRASMRRGTLIEDVSRRLMRAIGS